MFSLKLAIRLISGAPYSSELMLPVPEVPRQPGRHCRALLYPGVTLYHAPQQYDLVGSFAGSKDIAQVAHCTTSVVSALHAAALCMCLLRVCVHLLSQNNRDDLGLGQDVQYRPNNIGQWRLIAICTQRCRFGDSIEDCWQHGCCGTLATAQACKSSCRHVNREPQSAHGSADYLHHPMFVL